MQLADVDARVDVRLAERAAERRRGRASGSRCPGGSRSSRSWALVTTYVRSPTPRPRWTSKTARKIAAATSTSATRDAKVISERQRETRRTRRESSRRELRRVLRRVGCGLARDPEDHGARDAGREPGVALGPQRGPGEQGGARDGEEAEADQRPRTVSPVAERSRGDRVLLALVGHDERRGGVDEDAGPAEEGEDDEADAEDGGVDLEVASQASADAGEHAIRAAALQAADLWDIVWCVCVMVRGWPAAARRDHPE